MTMEAATPLESPPRPASKVAFWVGWVLTGLVGAFLVFDAGLKLAKPDFVVEATTKLGFSANIIVPLGITLLVATIVYLIPQTCVLGAILVTGYLGGAVSAHVLLWSQGVEGHGPFNVGFPVALGVLIWLALFLREPRLRSLLPLRT